jgi:hypothetical protein
VINEGIIWDFESVESSIDQLRIWVACSLKVEIQASLVVANNLTSKMYLPSIVKILVTLQKHQKHKSYTFYFIINHVRARFISKLSYTCEMTQTQLPKNIQICRQRYTFPCIWDLTYTKSKIKYKWPMMEDFNLWLHFSKYF